MSNADSRIQGWSKFICQAIIIPCLVVFALSPPFSFLCLYNHSFLLAVCCFTPCTYIYTIAGIISAILLVNKSAFDVLLFTFLFQPKTLHTVRPLALQVSLFHCWLWRFALFITFASCSPCSIRISLHSSALVSWGVSLFSFLSRILHGAG